MRKLLRTELSLHGINGDVTVEFAEGATLPGVRTVADLRLLPTWLRGMRLLVDREPPGLVRVEPILASPANSRYPYPQLKGIVADERSSCNCLRLATTRNYENYQVKTGVKHN